MKNILIIEDDAAIIQGLTDALTEERFKVTSSNDGLKGYQMAKRGTADLIILDLLLPTMQGKEICLSLRKEGITTPILMLTSKREEVDKIVGFEIGADDYVTKPFSVKELIARVKVLLRRQTEQQKEITEATFGDVSVDFKKHEAMKGKKKIEMSAKEFQLLKYFIEHQGDVISRSQLLDDVWGYDSMPTTRTVDNYILSLRKKIETRPSSPKHLLTVHTAGYKFVV